MKKEIIDLLCALKDAINWHTYETEYDGRMYSICNSCGGQDGKHNSDCRVREYEKLISDMEDKYV